MGSDRRTQDIKILREMEAVQEQIIENSDKLLALASKIDEITIDEKDYSLSNAEKCESEKLSARDACLKKYTAQRGKVRVKCAIFLWAGIAAGIVGIYGEIAYAVYAAIICLILWFIMRKIMQNPISKAEIAEIKKIDNEYEIKFEKAFEKDEKERQRYEGDVERKKEKKRAELKPEIEKIEKQREELFKRFNEISIVSEKDLDNDEDIIEELIDILESRRADNIKEALKEYDNQKRNEREALLRRQEAEAAAEAARKATMPGTVYLRVGSINTYSGALQNVRNTIYVDGAPFGVGSAGGSTIQLNPGPHSIYAQLEECGYIFTSPTQSFNLEGNGKVYIKIMIKNSYAYINIYSSESDLMRD